MQSTTQTPPRRFPAIAGFAVCFLSMTLRLLAMCAAVAMAAGCGGRSPPPKRRVIESGIASYSFGRYQRLVDVEVWVPQNRAVAHTASYVKKQAAKSGRLTDQDIVNAFVTEYERKQGVLRAVVKFSRRLAQESGYVVEEHKLGGVRVITVTGHGEAWALWGSGKYVVKVGGRGLDKIPSSVVEAYGDPYPSSLESGVLEGPLPEGKDQEPEIEQSDEDYDPSNPRPDWDHD
jgi:hypothetical protein